jgi:biotin carboxyl carrier protein
MGNAENAIKTVKAPMPGLILEIMIGVGEKANRNQPLVVIEAMKMENIIKSPVNASVKRILTSRGKSVEKNDLLIEFE